MGKDYCPVNLQLKDRAILSNTKIMWKGDIMEYLSTYDQAVPGMIVANDIYT